MNLTAVVRLIGINDNTLRAWERRYEAVTPERDAQGRRFYSDKEVEKIKLLWALVNEGHSIGLIANLSNAKLKAMVKKSLSPQSTNIESTNNATEKILSGMIQNLNKFNLEGLHHSLQRARFEMSIKEIVIDLVKPLMEEVGRKNQIGELSVSQEHLLSSLLRDYLGNIHQSLSPYDFSSRKHAKKILFTTREGDLHEFNVLLGAILSNVYQFQTFYLGPNMPAEDLAESCIDFGITYLVLGFTTLSPELGLITPKEYLKTLDKLLPRHVTFCCGGADESVLSVISKDREIKILSGLSDLDNFLSSKSTK